jgi:hypothetical protein
MTEPTAWDDAGAGRRGLHVALWAGVAASLTGAGLFLWAAQGEIVFTDVVSSALAWCF